MNIYCLIYPYPQNIILIIVEKNLKENSKVNNSRPKNLNLFTIRFPLPAIISIIHRITGAVLFFAIPFILWAFSESLTYDGFLRLHTWRDSLYFKFLILIVFTPFWFHCVAGIRHLLMDVNIGDSLKMGKLTASIAIVVALILILLTGIWIW